MGKDKKHRKEKKERRRSRSSSEESRSRRRDRSSSSERDNDSRLDKDLDKHRLEKKRLRELEKLRMKEKETPEEKRARRLAKKELKQKKRDRENDSYLPAELEYTNTNNPFNDVRLTETFVWGKKLEREGRSHLSQNAIEKETRARVAKNVREMEEFKRNRDARAAARTDQDMIQRDLDRRAHNEWTKKEAAFELQQTQERSRIRIEQGRAKPVDLLFRYISFKDETERNTNDDYDCSKDPLTFIDGLSRRDYEDLIEDIKVAREAGGEKNAQFWQDVRTIIDEELRKFNEIRDALPASVLSDTAAIVKGKSLTELENLFEETSKKVQRGGKGVHVDFWENMLGFLKVHIAKTRLRELHSDMRRLMLKRIREEQMDAMDTIKTEPEVKENFNEMMKPSTSAAPEMSSDDMDRQLRRKVHVSELDGLEGHDRELKWRSYDDEQLEAVTLQLYEQGSYSPKYGGFNDTMPGIEVLEGDEDAKNLLALRQKNRKNPEVVADVGASLRDIALRGMGDDEAIFSAEQKLDPQVHLWADKYRPRKPMYVNRVQTGFDWNKYNQTHYDMDNPPPKIVQGYKFNIFYPDLLNKRTNPDFKLFETEDPDFAILRFTSGPPYEDIAFKIVRREWEVSHKNGYKCQFQNGVFQLWFQFKKYRYRR